MKIEKEISIATSNHIENPICIARQNGKNQVIIPESEIYAGSVRWDNVSGGYQAKTWYYQLYATIDYNYGVSIGLDSSGKHANYNNGMKVVIPKSYNRKKPLIDTYQKLCAIAGEKPVSPCRPENGLTCTKAIIRELEDWGDDFITRKDLKLKLIEKGYPVKTICGAIRRLVASNRLSYEGSSFSPNQKIRLKNGR